MAHPDRKFSPDWRELIYRGVESDELDYKSAMNWNKLSRTGKGKLLRHCLALANTRGGYIVVGVSEDAYGRPRIYQGLTEEEAHSFDPSPVGSFLTHYADPPIDFTVERPVVDGKHYAIFVIRPFASLPHICTNSVETEVREGCFYIRTVDASSRPAVRSSELHSLIQRALRNQREMLGRMLRGILYETREIPDAPSAEVFRDDLSEVQQYFRHRNPIAPEEKDRCFLELSVAPPRRDVNRFEFAELRKAMLCGCQRPAGGGFFLTAEEWQSGFCTNAAFRIYREGGGKMTQLRKSALFWQSMILRSPGRQLSLEDLVKYCAEAVSGIGQIYTELGFAEEVLQLRLTISHAEGLTLECGRGDACRLPVLEAVLERSAADFASGAPAHAARLVREICERFNVTEDFYGGLDAVMEDYLRRI
ncbi:MAG: ATP-binding protein [Lentisphaeria bacterium]|nr:ATP-binding protein [Lentisphaeria bacterium]